MTELQVMIRTLGEDTTRTITFLINEATTLHFILQRIENNVLPHLGVDVEITDYHYGGYSLSGGTINLNQPFSSMGDISAGHPLNISINHKTLAPSTEEPTPRSMATAISRLGFIQGMGSSPRTILTPTDIAQLMIAQLALDEEDHHPMRIRHYP